MNPDATHRFDRRAALQAAIGAAGLSTLGRAEQPKPGSVSSVTANPVVETKSGKVRGFSNRGISAFLGIPYGASTTGANRFVPPVKPEPWPGVRNCLSYGHSCPQAGTGVIENDEGGRNSDEDESPRI